jgi:hypothetical protein
MSGVESASSVDLGGGGASAEYVTRCASRNAVATDALMAKLTFCGMSPVAEAILSAFTCGAAGPVRDESLCGLWREYRCRRSQASMRKRQTARAEANDASAERERRSRLRSEARWPGHGWRARRVRQAVNQFSACGYGADRPARARRRGAFWQARAPVLRKSWHCSAPRSRQCTPRS